jgi:DNA polymerase III epsilon subunit-like protein
VIDQHGNVYEDFNFINKDIFFGCPELMQSAYYARKIPQYLEQIERGEIKVASWYEIRDAFRKCCEKYSIKAVIAHNARFDYRSCTMTQRYETCSKYRYFFPKGVEIWDTLAMARDVIAPMPTYRKWCEANGYVLKNGQPRLTAEILFRFISKDNEFVEEHKAMEDVAIEREIFWYCIRKRKAMRRKAFKD